jgi:chemotaxis protein CheD
VLELPEVTIHIGQVYATREPTTIKTVLGSCIAVCLLDPVARVGGMNHFMLPAPFDGSGADERAAQYGIHAMDLLLGAVQKAGGDRRRLQAKLFGGGRVLRMITSGGSVPDRNIHFIEEFMRTERLHVVSQDLGGFLPRRISFRTDTGKVLVKRLGQHVLRQVRTEESEALQAVGQEAARPNGITLFDSESGRRS